MVNNLLETTGAPAYDDDGDDVVGVCTLFLLRHHMDLSDSILIVSHLMFYHHHHPPLVPVMDYCITGLSDFELRANGRNGFNANDRSKGGGHYHVVEEIGAFLNRHHQLLCEELKKGETALVFI